MKSLGEEGPNKTQCSASNKAAEQWFAKNVGPVTVI